MRTAGINLEHTKKTNRLLILRLLCSGNGFSRAELARRTGLAKMTVSNITNELVKAGLIEPLAAEHQGAGRPPVRLGLTRQSPAEVGLFLRRDSCTGICATMDMEILSQVEFSLGPGETFWTRRSPPSDTWSSTVKTGRSLGWASPPWALWTMPGAS